MSQVAFVDLSKGTIVKKDIPEDLQRMYLGGRGLNAYLLYNYLRPGADPFSPDNVLVFGAGMMNGLLGMSTGRWHVSAKSPETGVIGDSNAGGFFGGELMLAGFQHLVITGKASKPVYLWVHDGEVEIKDATRLWGMDTHETQEQIMDDLSDAQVQIALIGQAGENLVPYACVRHGLKRAAGRTGMGCVMGTKNLKAVAARGTRPIKVARPKELLEFVKDQCKRSKATKIFPIFSRWGTLNVFVVQNETGLLAAYNHQFNHSPEAEGQLEAEEFDEKYRIKNVSCFSCHFHCTGQYRISGGVYDGTFGEGPEWYFMGGFGPNVGCFDWETVLVANDLCNRYGIDIGTVTSYLGWLMELWQRKIIDKEFTGGLNFDWGNKETVIKMIHLMSRREGLGAKLAKGWQEVAKELGHGAEKYLHHTKNLPIESVIDDRPARATCIAQSTSNRGYDHLRGRVAIEFFGMPEDVIEKIIGHKASSDMTSWEGKPWMVVWTHRNTSLADCLGFCKLATPWTGSVGGVSFNDFIQMTNLVTGWNVTEPELHEIADRVWTIERLFNARESKIRRDGDLPPAIFYEPAKLGPQEGQKIVREEYEKALDEYYNIMGYKQDGTPKAATLKRLGLADEPSHKL